MTAARRQRKSLWAFLALAITLALPGLEPLGAATTERIVVDRHRGLAISGFDPVAYYTDATATLGRPEIEYSYAGATWRFSNEGNRGAFAANPEVYMPAFGGYDAAAAARGAAVEGHPLLWLILEQRLYFFETAQARNSFGDNPDRILAAAERKWPEILRRLSP
jgi:YHS domain-containing protein